MFRHHYEYVYWSERVGKTNSVIHVHCDFCLKNKINVSFEFIESDIQSVPELPSQPSCAGRADQSEWKSPLPFCDPCNN